MTELDKATRNLDKMSRLALQTTIRLVKAAETLKKDVNNVKRTKR